MENLAGRKDCDEYIRRELERCRIDIVEVELTRSEVPYTLEGRLGDFEFRRAWYYWVVRGSVPLEVAQEIYADPVGHTDIRVAGNAGCPPPEEWAHRGFVELYHVDTEVGLRLFADTIKAHELTAA